ncbi:MAG: hypothetical protein AUJ98_05460 [Bacteroidetes bacterium CG2_30_33_31]|nr:MAG: hypothetical protein AUJ98_05460 [Bacteroidetes bacterium CG2_30_33_31]
MTKKIFKLALPNIASNITIPLLGLVDTALMGHLDALDYLGAIALGSMIFNMVYWSLGFLRMGTVGFTAQAFGSKDNTQINLIFQRGILLALALGIIVIAIHPWLIEFGINFTTSGAGVKYFAADYVRIRIWAAPAGLLIMVFSGWFLGMQNAIYPMIIAIVANVFNIMLSFIFVYYLDMKSAGAALGTLIAQYLSLAVAILLFRKKYKYLWQKIEMAKLLNLSEMKSFFKVNSDIFIRTLGIIFVISFFTIKSANISDGILAVNSILFQFFLFYTFMLDGFANAAEALTGEYIGLKNLVNLKKSVKSNFLLGLAFSIVFSLVYFFFGNNLIQLLTNNNEVIKLAKPLMLWIVIMPLISFPAFILDGIFIGATASKSLRNAMIISVIFFFIPAYYLLPFKGTERLWIAFLIFLVARGFTLSLVLKKNIYLKYTN